MLHLIKDKYDRNNVYVTRLHSSFIIKSCFGLATSKQIKFRRGFENHCLAVVPSCFHLSSSYMMCGYNKRASKCRYKFLYGIV